MAESIQENKLKPKHLTYIAKVYDRHEKGMTPTNWQKLASSATFKSFNKNGEWWRETFWEAYNKAMDRFLSGKRLSLTEINVIKVISREQLFNFD